MMLINCCTLSLSLSLFLSLSLSLSHTHTHTDYGGLSIGIPVRENNMSLNLQNNAYFTSVALSGKVLHTLGVPLGGYPAPSLATEADN